MTKLMLAVALVIGLSGCSVFGSNDLNPPQKAFALNKEYQAAAHAALGCKAIPACWERAGEAIQAADNVAFSYVKSTTEAAQEWSQAPEEGDQSQAAVESSFNSLFTLAKNAITKLSALF